MIIRVPIDEVRSSLCGAVKILFGDPKALTYFKMTPVGFWNSFQAIWIILVPYMISMLHERHWLMGQNNLSLDAFPSGHFFVVKLFGLVIDWALLPVVLWLAADVLDIKTRYGPFIIARNWASVIVSTTFAVPTLMHIAGLISLDVMLLVELILLGFLVAYGYRIAMATLGKGALFCLALVLADFMMSLVVGQAILVMFAPGELIR